MDIQLLKKLPFGTKGKKLIITPMEIIKKQFFSRIKLLLLYPLNNLKIIKIKQLR